MEDIKKEIRRDIQNQISIQHVIDALNEAIEMDRIAIQNLISTRITCNDKLANHPTIQVSLINTKCCANCKLFNPDKFARSCPDIICLNSDYSEFKPKENLKKYYQVGFLGVLNGLFGIASDGFGAIAAVYKVKCPSCDKVIEGVKVGDNCPNCGNKLILGDLIRFKQIRKELIEKEND